MLRKEFFNEGTKSVQRAFYAVRITEEEEVNPFGGDDFGRVAKEVRCGASDIVAGGVQGTMGLVTWSCVCS